MPNTKKQSHFIGDYNSVGQFVSAAQFLRMSKNPKYDIQNVRFIPPKLGSKSFGKFWINLL